MTIMADMADLKCRTEQLFGIVVYRCAICNQGLHNPYCFPNDYPIEWRWCCACADTADIVIERSMEWIRYVFRDNSKILERCEKINKMITFDI